MTLMAARKFSDLVSHIDNDPERRARVDALEQEAWDTLAAHNLRELRRAREMTQAELARRLDRAQPAVAAMERTEDHLVSTVRAVVESLGGHLELTAVFDDHRIPIVAPARTRTRRERQRGAQAAAAKVETAAPSSRQRRTVTKHKAAKGLQRQRRTQVG
ncbi:MAG: helix-turn-helix transcriptional regulator [bacterium]|nr:helix-turn-helix transcriptional regulator [bacterium]